MSKTSDVSTASKVLFGVSCLSLAVSCVSLGSAIYRFKYSKEPKRTSFTISCAEQYDGGFNQCTFNTSMRCAPCDCGGKEKP